MRSKKARHLDKKDLSASFQAAVMDVLMAKTKTALKQFPVKMLVVAGGVAANQGLRERLATEITDVDVVIPPLRLCGDNAGMIAYASVCEYNQGHLAGLDLNARPSLTFESLK
jgi:N6-L-threonylcarbamoyladenine synthase